MRIALPIGQPASTVRRGHRRCGSRLQRGNLGVIAAVAVNVAATAVPVAANAINDDATVVKVAAGVGFVITLHVGIIVIDGSSRCRRRGCLGRPFPAGCVASRRHGDAGHVEPALLRRRPLLHAALSLLLLLPLLTIRVHTSLRRTGGCRRRAPVVPLPVRVAVPAIPVARVVPSDGGGGQLTPRTATSVGSVGCGTAVSAGIVHSSSGHETGGRARRRRHRCCRHRVRPPDHVNPVPRGVHGRALCRIDQRRSRRHRRRGYRRGGLPWGCPARPCQLWQRR